MNDDVLCFAFRGRDLLVRIDEGRATVLSERVWAAFELPSVRSIDLGDVHGRRVLAVEVAADAPLPEGIEPTGLRKLHALADEADFRRASRAVQMIEWDRSNQFCGRCGERTTRVEGEWARRCARCGTSAYPRLSPAVIVLVERGHEVLLGRSARFPTDMYSTLAGFVEPGESIEEAVAREIREESGVEVRALRYFGSQSWPFPDSLMIAFHAEYAGGDVVPQPGEIEDARWFTVDAMPKVPPRISIARALIDDWVRRQGRDPSTLKSGR